MRATKSGRSFAVAVRASLAFGVAVLLLAPFVPVAGATPGTRSGTGPGGNPGAGFLYSVSWNGRGTSNATTTGTALTVSFGSAITMQFHWSSGGSSGPPGGVSEVEFQAFLFGFSFITRALTNTPALTTPTGVTNLTWDPGALTYIVSGVYLCLASIFAPNGSTIWSESFYIKANAPFVVGALLPLILLLLLVYELYAVLTVKPTAPKGVQPWSASKETDQKPESGSGKNGGSEESGPVAEENGKP
ncbi:MAG: hypothetical protein L3K07_03380 [Thermoplasmata archaeon]|nr:hypothetical protein [Thermoplasmata archaeon]